jgi:hypothetical protein
LGQVPTAREGVANDLREWRWDPIDLCVRGRKPLPLGEGVEEGGANPGYVVTLARRGQVQAIAAQLDCLLGGQHASSFHAAMRHTLLMDRREAAHQGFGDFAALVGGQGLALQHIGQALLDGLHERINHQGVIHPHLPNFGNADQVGMIEVLRSFQAGNDLIRVRKRLGEADGCWDGSRI